MNAKIIAELKRLEAIAKIAPYGKRNPFVATNKIILMRELRQHAAELIADAERMDMLEDSRRCYWVTVQTQPNGRYIREGQGPGLRAAIDAVLFPAIGDKQ